MKQESSAEALPHPGHVAGRGTGTPAPGGTLLHREGGRLCCGWHTWSGTSEEAEMPPQRRGEGRGGGRGPPPAWHGSSAQPEPPDDSGVGLGAGVAFACLPGSPPSSSVTRNLGLTLERPRGRDLQSWTGRMDRQTDTDGRGEERHRQAIEPFSPQRCQRITTRLVLRRGKPGRTPISPGCPTPPLLAGAPPFRCKAPHGRLPLSVLPPQAYSLPAR